MRSTGGLKSYLCKDPRLSDLSRWRWLRTTPPPMTLAIQPWRDKRTQWCLDRLAFKDDDCKIKPSRKLDFKETWLVIWGSGRSVLGVKWNSDMDSELQGFFFVRGTEFSVWWEGNIWGGMGLRYSNLARAGLLCLIFLTASLVVKWVTEERKMKMSEQCREVLGEQVCRHMPLYVHSLWAGASLGLISRILTI